jgi:DNA-binding GntR family transcriptional regulator
MQDVTTQVYRKLKEKIIFLRYQPGKSLNIRELSEEFSVSPTPIREALICLGSEGLVCRSPGNGAYVAEISVQNFKDLTEIRLFLMELLARLAVKRVTAEEIQEIDDLIGKLRETGDRFEAIRIRSQFFHKLYRATKNEPLARILQSLHNQVSRLWFLVPEEMAARTELGGDFDAIVAALRARDEEGCIEALRRNKLHFVHLIKQAILDDSMKSLVPQGITHGTAHETNLAGRR